MAFIDQYNLLQKEMINLSEKEDLFLGLIKSFRPNKELDALLESVKAIPIDFKEDYIRIHNLLDILSHQEFKKKLNTTHKKKVKDFLLNILITGKQELQSYKLLWFRIGTLFDSYGEQLTVSEAKKLMKIDTVFQEEPKRFIGFFRTNDKPSEYWSSVLTELHNKLEKEREIKRYCLDTEDLSYIGTKPKLLDKFVDAISDSTNIDVIISLFKQRTKSKYTGDASQKALQHILTLLNSTQLSKIESVILGIMDKYFDVRHSHTYRYWHIEELFTSEFFHSLLAYLISKNSSFFIDILNYLNQQDRYIHGPVNDVVVYSLTKELAQDFVEHQIVDENQRVFFEIYFALQKSNKSDKEEIISRLETLKSDWIEQNKKNIESSQQQQRERQLNEKKEKRDEIEAIVNSLVSGQADFSEYLLYLYETHAEWFLEDEVEVVKSQIHTILRDEDYFDLEKNAEVHYDEEKDNTFSRPRHMSNGTLERCYELGKKLGIDVMEEYQSRYVRLLPFAFNPDSSFLNDIKSLDEDDVEYILKVYSPERDEKDDLRVFHPYTFYQVVTKFKKEFQADSKVWERTILNFKEMLKLPEKRLWVRAKKNIIDLLADTEQKDFFKEGISKYIGPNNLDEYNYFNDLLSEKIPEEDESNRFELWATANFILSQNFSDEDAILWRFRQLEAIEVSLERLPTGRVHGISKLRSELDFFGRDEQLFVDALKHLKYPQYEKEVINVLVYSFTLEENNLVRTYLQKFVFDYYDSIGDEEDRIDALVNLKKQKKISQQNSRSFFEWYFPKLLSKLGYEHLEIYKLKNSYTELEEENLILRQENKGLKKLFDKIGPKTSDVPIVVVEGKTDKKYLEEAYLKVNNRVCQWRIIVAGGCYQMPRLLASYIDSEIKSRIYFIVDWDFGGVEFRNNIDDKKKGLHNYLFKPSNNTREEPVVCKKTKLFVKKHKKLDYHALFIPVPENFRPLVFKSPISEKKGISVQNSNILDKTHGIHCRHTIENLLFNESVYQKGGYNFDDGHNYFSEEELTGGVKHIMYTGNSRSQKMNFARNITLNPKLSPERENFKPIFDYIDGQQI